MLADQSRSVASSEVGHATERRTSEGRLIMTQTTRMRYRPSGTVHGPSLGYAGYRLGWWRRLVMRFRMKFYARSDHLPPY